MGFIYKITNLKTGKMYVGQTRLTIEQRWQEHLHTARTRTKNYLLYQAMRKSGIDNFVVEELEQCPDKMLNNRERYWINKLGTFGSGYNMNEGGLLAGTKKPTMKELENWRERFYSGETIVSIAESSRFARTTIMGYLKLDKNYNRIAKRNMIHKSNSYNIKRLNKRVFRYDLSGNLIDSISTSILSLKEKEIIRECAIGKRRSYKGFIYCYRELPPIFITLKYNHLNNEKLTKESKREWYFRYGIN